jgi:hypothetical protein
VILGARQSTENHPRLFMLCLPSAFASVSLSQLWRFSFFFFFYFLFLSFFLFSFTSFTLMNTRPVVFSLLCGCICNAKLMASLINSDRRLQPCGVVWHARQDMRLEKSLLILMAPLAVHDPVKKEWKNVTVPRAICQCAIQKAPLSFTQVTIPSRPVRYEG